MTYLLSAFKISDAVALAFVITGVIVTKPSAAKATIGFVSYPPGSEAEGFPCQRQSYRRQ